MGSKTKITDPHQAKLLSWTRTIPLLPLLTLSHPQTLSPIFILSGPTKVPQKQSIHRTRKLSRESYHEKVITRKISRERYHKKDITRKISRERLLETVSKLKFRCLIFTRISSMLLLSPSSTPQTFSILITISGDVEGRGKNVDAITLPRASSS